MRRGQHFLVDGRVAQRQIDYACLSPGDVVLEIGPGEGALTRRMAGRVSRVIAIEIDGRLAEGLRGLPGVEVIHADALAVDFGSLSFNKVVSNLPYQISSPVTFKLLAQDFELAVLMYQREFARRLVAEPGSRDYSRLSVMAQYRARWEILEIVPPSAFRPHPEVHSCVVRAVPRPPPFAVWNPEVFEDVVRILFSHRRKTIKNALRAERYVPPEVAADLPYARQRVGKLTPEQIGELSNALAQWREEHETAG
ncbi:MAG: 16S rRNA (adenine(1518)-N(6)/adenine(1519)-N(6))-dimethyltransferase RsmA [Candidatus Thermoplasmatota archaeon]|nr:16S rRNA (adenine(1518)-N(6)/adenine(1519)-N(6))-dimethyltransferase RsmA [Candidatus Thermoplasmatota archaeon]